MDFAVRKDARQWFAGINEDLDLGFDIFYFCFIDGIATRRKCAVRRPNGWSGGQLSRQIQPALGVACRPVPLKGTCHTRNRNGRGIQGASRNRQAD